MNRILAAASLCAILSGCAGVPAAIVGGGVLGTALQVVAAAQPVLTEAAQLGCEGQRAANFAGDLATRLGSVRGAAAASETSTILGLACTWL